MLQYYKKAYREIFKDIWPYIGMTLLYLFILGILSLTYIGAFISGIFTIGYFFYIRNKITNGSEHLNDIFTALTKSNFAIPSILAGLVSCIFVFFGTLIFLIPGILAFVGFTFIYLFILDGETDFWNAMKKSYSMVSKDWWFFINYVSFPYVLMIIPFLAVIFSNTKLITELYNMSFSLETVSFFFASSFGIIIISLILSLIFIPIYHEGLILIYEDRKEKKELPSESSL